MTAAADVCLVTSFSPHRIAEQQRAAQSWQRLGAHVLSLNGAAERSALEPLFPSVRFATAARDASAFLRKPCVFIKDIAEAAASTGAAVCGIINADITLIDEDEPALINRLAGAARGALVFGSRVDYTASDRSADAVYTLGYDYFFFDRAFAAMLPDEPFCLGAPWWDYWLPAVALEQSIPIRRVTSRIAFHERHDTAYSHEVWMMYAGLMASRLEGAHERPPFTPQSRNAATDIGKRTIQLAQKFREQLEDRAETISVDRPL